MSLAQELQSRSTRVPSSKNGLANWLEDYATQLELGMGLHSLIEPRTIYAALNGAIEWVVTTDNILKQ
eukprot:2294596-Prorocentrum_lima.AAC.1